MKFEKLQKYAKHFPKLNDEEFAKTVHQQWEQENGSDNEEQLVAFLEAMTKE